jgi:hypothetical protein
MRKALRMNKHHHTPTPEIIDDSPKISVDQKENKKSDTQNWAWM